MAAMLTLIAALAIAPLSPPAEPLAGHLRAAIWYDLQVNALIGNGNWLASLWYNAGNETAPDLHIMDLGCKGGSKKKDCHFTLLRDGGVVEAFGEKAPDKIACTAKLIVTRGEEGWSVKHDPPIDAGHSQTSMRCRTVSS